MRTTTIFLCGAVALGALACEKQAEPADAVGQTQAGNTAGSGQTNSEPSAEVDAPQATETGKLLTALDAEIALREKRLAKRKDWMDYEALAGAHMGRARLTGDVSEYVKVGDALREAFEVAPENAGPFATRAQYHFTIHMNGLVEQDLTASEKSMIRQDVDEASAEALRGDVDLNAGDLDAAWVHFEAAEDNVSSFGSAGRIANYRLKTGDYDGAAAWYGKALERVRGSKQSKAWALLHRGIVELERNRVKDALSWYEKAAEELSGWYLVEEHIAEAKLLLGDPDAAIEIYESVIARTPNGEFMAAMADAQEAKGNDAAAREWREKAAKAFERDLARLPSAVSGHAFEFFLAEDPERALELARSNFENRAGHESRVQLAQALVKTGKSDEAVEVLRPTAASAWATPGALATVAIVFEKADPKLAAKAAERVAAVDGEAVEEMRESLKSSG